MILPQNLSSHNIINIFGATASGKSAFAIEFAKKHNGIIINADSSQIYKQCSILTNVPSIKEQQGVEHLLFQIADITEHFSVGKWLAYVKNAVQYCKDKNCIPIIVGGTGLYFSSLLYGISVIESNEENRNIALREFEILGKEEFIKKLIKIDKHIVEKFQDSQRLIRAYEVFLNTGKSILELQSTPKLKVISADFINIYITKPREILYKIIDERFKSMIDKGAIEEVKYVIKNISDATSVTKKILGLFELSSYLK